MERHFDLAYGNGFLELDVPAEADLEVLLPKEVPALVDPEKAVADALAHPAGTPPLLELLKNRKPRKITVVVNDETRPTPYKQIFPPLLDVFAKAGVRDDQVVFVIATGIHAPQSPELCASLYGAEMTERFKFVNHIGTDAESLADMGKTSSGYECLINRLAVEADFLITVGVVMPHYFAGFSGGRKSILPGLAGHETVEKNHARMVELLDALPPIDENPVSLEMIEVAQKVGVDFIINVVTDDHRRLVAVEAGDLVEAWRKCVDVSKSMYEVPFRRYADVTVASACGYPRDVNVYQAQKALDHAEKCARKDGIIIWVAECTQGFGEKVFEKWIDKRLDSARLMSIFRENFELGGHKAYAIAKSAAHAHIVLISKLSAAETALIFAEKAGSLQKVFDDALEEYGDRVTVMPYGCLTLPVKA